jgi:fermentation-respiration switch protein FrsA (DUF1100 family)
MAEQSEEPQTEGSSSAEKTIRVIIDIPGAEKGGKIIVAQGSSNHYTSHGNTPDTCCTCDS